MNTKETQKAKQLLKKYFLVKKVYYRTHNENLYKSSETLLKEATRHLLYAANHGDGEALQLLTQLDAKSHIVLNTSLKRPWYYYALWVLLIAYLLIFFIFMGQFILTKSATPNPTYYPQEVPVKKPEVPSTLTDEDGTLKQAYDYPLHEPLLIIRNALHHYVEKNKTFPKQLSDLTKGYPYNYLHTIPLNPVSGTNEVYSTPNKKGGWYYNPTPNSALPITDQVIESLKPNAGTVDETYFSSLSLKISLEDKQLYLTDESYIYQQFPISVGANNQTPLGPSKVSQKLINPRSDIPLQDNPYGTRLLELTDSNYAIHGTNDNTSIGNAVTNGCIRLTNADIEQLFAMTPLETPIQIANTSLELFEDTAPTPFQPKLSNQPNALHEYLSNPDNSNPQPQIKTLAENLKAIYNPLQSPPKNPEYTEDTTKEWRH